MKKTTLGNNYKFDQENFVTVMNAFVEDLILLVKDVTNPFQMLDVLSKIADRVATGCLFLFHCENELVPFEDEEWYTMFYDEIKKKVSEKTEKVYKLRLREMTDAELMNGHPFRYQFF
jgi:hypothetical protein